MAIIEQVRETLRERIKRGATFDELETIVLHPPIQRFLSRWQPGDPPLYLGALWAP